MKFYLSSYKIGNGADKLKQLTGERMIGYIPNAIDYVGRDVRAKSDMRNMADLSDLGIDVQLLDLKDYFGDTAKLEVKLESLGGVWVRGGNAFILRQAMNVSGFDYLIKNMDRDDFLYSGYSAGVCVLGPSIEPLRAVDDPILFPYEEPKQDILDGLNILDYLILPHYESEHHDPDNIVREIEFCKGNNMPFKTLRDGEVIVLE